MDTRPSLLCTVRECKSPLLREPCRVVCPQGHSFDIARSGYVNLLQPQDRRSKNPGDTVAAVKARRALHDLGVTAPLLAAASRLLEASSTDTVLDIGSGEGFYLGSLASQSNFQAHGVDISLPAISAAAKRYRNCQWVVANADRFVPYAKHSFSKVLSLTARMNPDEFHRILQVNGKLLLAVPAPDDLIELRGIGRDRTTRTVEDFALKFTLIRSQRATATADLDAEAVANVLLSIYRPLQAKPARPLRLTFSLDLLLFGPRND